MNNVQHHTCDSQCCMCIDSCVHNADTNAPTIKPMHATHTYSAHAGGIYNTDVLHESILITAVLASKSVT